MLYPKPVGTRPTSHGQRICSAHIPQLHKEREIDGHTERVRERQAHKRMEINSKQEYERQ